MLIKPGLASLPERTGSVNEPGSRINIPGSRISLFVPDYCATELSLVILSYLFLIAITGTDPSLSYYRKQAENLQQSKRHPHNIAVYKDTATYHYSYTLKFLLLFDSKSLLIYEKVKSVYGRWCNDLSRYRRNGIQGQKLRNHLLLLGCQFAIKQLHFPGHS